MKLGRLNINLQNKKPKVDEEIGSSRGMKNQSLFDGEVISTKKIGVKELRAMIDNDGTAQSLFNVMVMPILSAGWMVQPEDNSAEAKKQAEFVEDKLTRPPHKGGMTTPFELVLDDMLLALLEGHRAYEKVYTLDENGKIAFKKIARRDNETLFMLQDERGEFNGMKQYAFIGNTWKMVEIPKEKSFLFTFGKSHNWILGRSAFQAAYYHYDKKHRAYYLANQRLQNAALPLKTVQQKEGSKSNQDALDDTVTEVDSLGFNSTVGISSDFDVNTLDLSKGSDPQPYIDHHNSEMARSILAQFMMLGTNNDVGSWALSADQSDLFIQSLQSVARALELHINSYLLPDLHDFNFERPLYATVKFNSMASDTQDMLKDIFKQIVKRPDGLPDDFVRKIIEKAEEELDLSEEDTNNLSRGRSFLAHKRWKRDLTPAESKVNFAGIEKKMNTLEAEFLEEARPVWNEAQEKVASKVESLLKNDKAAKVSEQEIIPQNLRDQYRKVIVDQMMDAYQFGKTDAADEIDVKSPENKQKSKNEIKQQAAFIVNKQMDEITAKAREKVISAMRQNELSVNLDIEETVAEISEGIEAYFEEKGAATAAAAISSAINIGRDDTFDEHTEKISLYQYSAILDDRTCPICEDLDGSVVDGPTKRSTQWQPPIHINCRCIWVSIMREETEQPDTTGLPSSPGGASAPLLEHSHAKT